MGLMPPNNHEQRSFGRQAATREMEYLHPVARSPKRIRMSDVAQGANRQELTAWSQSRGPCYTTRPVRVPRHSIRFPTADGKLLRWGRQPIQLRRCCGGQRPVKNLPPFTCCTINVCSASGIGA